MDEYGEKYRVVRGGAWDDFRSLVRCAFRDWFVPDVFYFKIGFRVASPGSDSP